MKDILLNRSGASWLAVRKFLYFGAACVAAAILAQVSTSDAYEGKHLPSVGAVCISMAWRMGWYLFLFLLPWEAYKAIMSLGEYNKILDKIEARAAQQEARADALARMAGPQVVEVEKKPYVDFQVERTGDARTNAERADWRKDWEEKQHPQQQEERTPIGFPQSWQGVKASARGFDRSESYAEWCKRLNVRG